MAANPATETSGALFRAIRAAGVEAELAYCTHDEVCAQAGRNVAAVLNVRFSELGARIDAIIDADNSRIDTLQRVICPLTVLLSSTVFDLLYRVLTSGS